MMGDKYDEIARRFLNEHGAFNSGEYLKTSDVRLLGDLLRQTANDAAAEGRRNAIEKSAALIGRQVEPRDA